MNQLSFNDRTSSIKIGGHDADFDKPTLDNEESSASREFLSVIDLGYNYSPIVSDSDGDGLLDGAEIITPANTEHNNKPDCEAAGHTWILVEAIDVCEPAAANNHLNFDSDGDGVHDGLEVYVYETNPLSKDSDMDRIEDRLEIEVYGTDPNGNINPLIFYNFSIPENEFDSQINFFRISEYFEPDTDGDGVLDSEDLYPADPNEWRDSDSDGVGDYYDPRPYTWDSQGGSGSSGGYSGGSSGSSGGSSNCNALMYYDYYSDVFYLYDPCTDRLVIV